VASPLDQSRLSNPFLASMQGGSCVSKGAPRGLLPASQSPTAPRSKGRNSLASRLRPLPVADAGLSRLSAAWGPARGQSPARREIGRILRSQPSTWTPARAGSVISARRRGRADRAFSPSGFAKISGNDAGFPPRHRQAPRRTSSASAEKDVIGKRPSRRDPSRLARTSLYQNL
jgi:hypothetical protein